VQAFDRWIKLWLVAAALLGAGLLVALWSVDRYRDWTIDQRVDQHMPLIRSHAEAKGLPVELVRAVVRVESGGHARARSEADARGLMQVTPIALRDVQQRFQVGSGDLYDPEFNLHVGTTYLRYLLDRFDGDVTLALAAYHMGPTAVRRAGRETGLTGQDLVDARAGRRTRAYVANVLKHAGS
jgi:soluble lytic murein transglycosylase